MTPTIEPSSPATEDNNNKVCVDSKNLDETESVTVISIDVPVKPPRESEGIKKTKKTATREVYHDAIIAMKPDTEDTEDKHRRQSLYASHNGKRKKSVDVECDLNFGGIDYDSDEETNKPKKHSTSSIKHRDDSGKKTDTLDSETSSRKDSSSSRQSSFTRRTSIAIGNLRRKSIEVVKHTFSHYKGIVMAMSSAIFFTLTAVIVQYLKDIHPGEMACFRFLGILLFTIPMIITAEVHPLGPREKRHFLLLRGVAGATSLYLRYSALHYLPIANATVIVLSMPVFVCIFARIFLKEPCGIFHCVSIGVTLVGIGFTAKIGALVGLTDSEGIDKAREITGLVYSMGATLIGASVYIFVRKVKECHNSVILFNFALVAICETAILTGIDDGFVLPTGYAPWLLMSLAVLSFYAQLLLTKALQVEEASMVSVTRSSAEVVCAFIFQIVIFHKLPDLYACIGALLVTTSVLLTSARKWVMTLPGDHLGRKLLGFTLK